MIAFNFKEENRRNKTFNVPCKVCGLVYSILLNEKDYDDWQENKGYIQDLLSYLTSAERELLISQTCDACWQKLYPNNEEISDEI